MFLSQVIVKTAVKDKMRRRLLADTECFDVTMFLTIGIESFVDCIGS